VKYETLRVYAVESQKLEKNLPLRVLYHIGLRWARYYSKHCTTYSSLRTLSCWKLGFL